MNPCIYLFTFPNGKQYVGQAKNFDSRMAGHKGLAKSTKNPKHNLILYKAIRKYGWNNINREIICYCKEEQLNDKEIEYIEQYDTVHPNGYNMNSGGDAPTYVSDATKKLMSKKHNERYKNPDVIAQLSEAQKKRYAAQPMSKETKNKISSAKIQYYQEHEFPKNVKNKISKKALERYEKNGISVDVRDKISKGHRINGSDENLPRLITKRIDGSTTKYRIRNHPLCISKTFNDLDECIQYLDELDKKLSDQQIIPICTLKPDATGAIKRKQFHKI